VPYVVTFTKAVTIDDPEQYINDCCIGGDKVLEQLLPALRERYGDVQPVQEDWGWFAWFEEAGVKLAVDVHTDDAAADRFQVHLTSRKPRLLLGGKVEDTPELDSLRELVLSRLRDWPVTRLELERVDEKYMPL
jgi:hypothetical protein